MRTMAAVFAVALIACSGGERQIAGPGDGPGTPGTPALTVRVGLADADLAQTLGWEGGVPDVEVHALRNGEGTYETATTNADGEARFPGALAGRYRVYAERTLNDSEAALVGTRRAFGDGNTVDFGVQSTFDLTLAANDESPGLLISEMNDVVPAPWETGGSGYAGGQYLEVYNASDKTLYLDGKLFGRAYRFGRKDYSFNACSASESIREDPAGIYTREVIEFPGDGTDYPVAPGEVKLVALSAIDHTAVHPWLFDLSGADFEIRPSGAADNPSVPNLINVGEEPWRLGFSALTGAATYFLADPVDLEALPALVRDHTGRDYIRLPADAILDVISKASVYPDSDIEFPPCDPMIHDRFDRYEAALVEIGEGAGITNLSYQRLVLRTEGGIDLLQDTNTSAADFIMAPHAPGSVTR